MLSKFFIFWEKDRRTRDLVAGRGKQNFEKGGCFE